MKKQQIIEVARSLFMQYGIRSVSMDDVCRELGISKKTLYSEIETKSELVKQVLESYTAGECHTMQCILAETSDAIEAMVNIGFNIIQKVRNMKPGVVYDLQKYYRNIYNEWSIENRKFVREQIMNNLKSGIAQGYYRDNLDVEIIARLYVGKVQVIMNEEFFPVDQFRQEDVIKQHFQYHLHGILTPKGVEKLYSQNLLSKLWEE